MKDEKLTTKTFRCTSETLDLVNQLVEESGKGHIKWFESVVHDLVNQGAVNHDTRPHDEIHHLRTRSSEGSGYSESFRMQLLRFAGEAMTRSLVDVINFNQDMRVGEEAKNPQNDAGEAVVKLQNTVSRLEQSIRIQGETFERLLNKVADDAHRQQDTQESIVREFQQVVAKEMQGLVRILVDLSQPRSETEGINHPQ